MPVIAEIYISMQEFTGQKIETSDQHREAYDPRIQSDDKDRKTFLGYLSEFACHRGALADNRVNADFAKTIGRRLLLMRHLLEGGFSRII